MPAPCSKRLFCLSPFWPHAADSVGNPSRKLSVRAKKIPRQYQAVRLDNGMTVLLVSIRKVKSPLGARGAVGSLEDPESAPGSCYLENI